MSDVVVDADGHVCEPPDLRYPGVVAELREHAGDLAPGARAQLLGQNALRLYGAPPPR